MRKKGSLDQIDEWFAAKGNSANTYLYMGLALAAVIAYFALSTYSVPYLEESESNLASATDKLEKSQREYDTDFNGNPTGKVAQERAVLKREETNLENAVNKINYLDVKLTEISKLTYNEKNWATFMDSLTTLAENNNIKIHSIISSKKEPSAKNVFKPEALLNIDVKFEGTFQNVVRYVNLIEQSEMIVDVNKMDINGTEEGKIGGTVGMSIWGVNYK
ncbi:type 4a pilus biogenesis protein PilO [Campylobacter sp. JMF_02 ED1]|uniref:type 4a pilus biogenesis protein PilO n=1 Tax=unclassified Campylobacter TaxID=2593542 RepID=UPI0022E9B69D|nr:MULTISPECIES: type 4a pilus biogenesis protein PilO [unclassified Campylobacter]MDA3049343.1 type 4a pilus biogenesis protein PilO [Campylobacter sp. JMF_15 NE4]MDA3051229.1 type 4a pilus biogenesis protein PilO [Campylobacter sp. JMF_02 ED1]